MSKPNQPMKTILVIALVAAILTGSVLMGADVTQAASGTIDRLKGSDRYATSAEIAGEKFNSRPYCIVTRGDVYADGLAASTLAGALDCPVLLTRSNELPSSVNSRIKSLGYPKVIILGGTSAVSTGVETTLKSLVGSSKVERIGGVNRFDTAAKIARRAKQEYSLPNHAYIVSGWASADSLVAGPAAFLNKVPILQVDKNSIPDVTKNAISDLGITRLIIVGGTAVVNNAVQSALEKLPSVYSVTRISGSTRYETAVEFAKSQFSGVGNFSLVRGADNNLADAIGATVLGYPILYVDLNAIPSAVNNYMNSEVTSSSHMFIIGGDKAISDGIYTDARAKITGETDTVKFSKSSLYLDGEETNTLTISGTTFKNINFYKDDHYTISGLPSGVTSTLERTGSYTAKLTLSGSPSLTANQTVSVRILAAAVNSGKNLPSASFTLTKTAEEAVVVGDLKLNSTTPPAATVGQGATDTVEYKFAFKASGGKAPYTYTFVQYGSYTLESSKMEIKHDTEKNTFVLSNTAPIKNAGTHYFGIEVTDSSDTPKIEQFHIKLVINDAPDVKPGTKGKADANPPDATVGYKYNHAIKVTGGTGPFTFLKTGGNLPENMTLSSAGVLSTGTKNITDVTGSPFTFKIQVMDKYGVKSNIIDLTININPVPKFNDGTTPLNIGWGLITPIDITSHLAQDGTGPYTCNNPTLPNSLKWTVDDNVPIIEGLLKESGTFTITLTDRWGAKATGKFEINMIP